MLMPAPVWLRLIGSETFCKTLLLASVAVYQQTKSIKFTRKIPARFRDNSEMAAFSGKGGNSPHVKACGYHGTLFVPNPAAVLLWIVVICKTDYIPSFQPTFSRLTCTHKHISTANMQHQEQSGLNIWLKYILTSGAQRPGPADLLIQLEEGPLGHLSHGNLEGQQ